MVKKSSDVNIIKRKTPFPLLFYFLIGIPVILFGMYVCYIEHDYMSGLGVLSLGGSILGLLFLNDRGYQLAYDDGALYSRDWDFADVLKLKRSNWHNIAYKDIATMEGKFHPRSVGMASFVPFQFLEVRSNHRSEKDIWIYPEALKSNDLFILYDHIYEKRPDIFPAVLIDMMDRRRALKSDGYG